MNDIEEPVFKQAVIYNEDHLTDYAMKGGSVWCLFLKRIREGNCVVTTQAPSDAPPVVRSLIETEKDVQSCKENGEKMVKWLQAQYSVSKADKS
jgi:hypothetical protein